MPPRARTTPADVAAPANNALGSLAAVDAAHPSDFKVFDQPGELPVAAEPVDGLFETPEPPPYLIPPARTMREAPARMIRVREVIQEIRDDIAAAVLVPADGEFTPIDPTVAAALVGLANCVEALAEINT